MLQAQALNTVRTLNTIAKVKIQRCPRPPGTSAGNKHTSKRTTKLTTLKSTYVLTNMPRGRAPHRLPAPAALTFSVPDRQPLINLGAPTLRLMKVICLLPMLHFTTGCLPTILKSPL